LRFQNLWNLIMYSIFLFYENVHLSVFLRFFKVEWVLEKQGVTFLMVPPKDKIGLQTLVLSPKEYNILFENIINWLIM
jgi:hypothetical protein